MLQEIMNSRLTAERRRWFTDDYMDLYLWQDQEGTLEGFQVCFDKQRTEKAFTWVAPHYASVAEIDQGEDTPLKNMTPILVPANSADLRILVKEFRARSRELEQSVTIHVEKTIEEVANKAL